MMLSIVIPAFNEEEAIAATIERTLAAREEISSRSPVEQVEVIVVSDGSTDRTAEIARGYGAIRLIEFPKNRGYGAAIKEGFRQSSGAIVGFLDADGTCDPAFFATLCRALIEDNASVAIGSRMGPQSRMPAVRRLGNRMYAVLLSLLSNRAVSDTASGMRVIRRDALEQLYPLPDGLHFTPAMSARVLMDRRLEIVERPMPYEERVGESKLNVLRDGLRFLSTILHMAMMWSPGRLFAASAVLCLGTMVVLALYPLETWLRLSRLHEDMIYRLLFCAFLGAIGTVLVSAWVTCESLQRLWDGRAARRTFTGALADRIYTFRGFAALTIVAAPVMAWLVGRGVWTRIAHGFVDLHWSRIVLAGLIAFALIQMLIAVLIVNLIRFHVARDTARQTGREVLKASTAGRLAASATPVRSVELAESTVPATA